MEEIYDQYKYLPEMRDAMTKWEAHLSKLFDPHVTYVHVAA